MPTLPVRSAGLAPPAPQSGRASGAGSSDPLPGAGGPLPRVDPPSGVRPPLQARSRRTFRAIVDAATELLAEEGPEGLTVQELLDRARVGAGSFYARFDDRDALVAYLHWLARGRGEGWWEEYLAPDRWAGLPAWTLLAAVVRVLVRAHFRREPELRASLAQALARPADRLMVWTVELDEALARRVAALLETRGREIRHPRPRRAVALGLFQLLGTLRHHLLFPDSASLPGGVSEEELIVELTRSWAGYLGVEGVPDAYGELLRPLRLGRS